MNYFELFALKRQYLIDQNLLQKNYFSVQAKYHPDKANSEEERRRNLEHSMLANEAFKVLKDDYLRAEYLLKLAGTILEDRQLKTVLSANQLEDILDQYELLENMEDLPSLQALEKEKMAEQELLVATIGNQFERNNLKETLDLTVRLKYLTNLVGNIRLKIRNANN